jgi:uncharacterized glyoxalase superfamily protein PhnB
MKFGYTIIYVRDVSTALGFFEKAFGFQTRFIHESDYGELCTGETTLSFASHDLGTKNLPDGYISVESSSKPLGIEIALVTEDVDKAHTKAILAGATEVSSPIQKPWGQRVSYVRSPEGILIELCTPVG